MPKRAAPSTTSSTTPLSAPSTFTDSLPLPSLIVFDLDYTLWPFWVDTHASPPFKHPSSPQQRGTHMLDRHGESFAFYADVPAILAAAAARDIPLGLASRTHTPELARDLLRGLTIPAPSPATTTTTVAMTTSSEPSSESRPRPAIEVFTHAQIFPGNKTAHFRKIQESTRKQGDKQKVAFEDMLFFDDESRNRNVETELGVTFWLVRDGVTRDEVDKGVREWRRRKGVVKQ